MSVTAVPQKFKSHGREFATVEEAHRFDRLWLARENLETAQRAFQRSLGESAKTADGQLFDFDGYHCYWHVFKPFGSIPRIEQFTYTCWSWSVKEDGETVQIKVESSDGKESWQTRYIDIAELYSSEAAATAMLIAAQEEWLKERAAEIAKFKKRAAL